MDTAPTIANPRQDAIETAAKRTACILCYQVCKTLGAEEVEPVGMPPGVPLHLWAYLEFRISQSNLKLRQP